MSEATGPTTAMAAAEALNEPDPDKARRMLAGRNACGNPVKPELGTRTTDGLPPGLNPMARAVLDLVRRCPGTSWVELCRFIEGARGERAVFAGRNVLLWNGISQELIDAVTSLHEAGLIEVKASIPLVYMVDGEIPTLPWARRVPVDGYALPRWLPTVLNPSRGKPRRGHRSAGARGTKE
jgi:hypothetical protein